MVYSAVNCPWILPTFLECESNCPELRPLNTSAGFIIQLDRAAIKPTIFLTVRVNDPYRDVGLVIQKVPFRVNWWDN